MLFKVVKSYPNTFYKTLYRSMSTLQYKCEHSVADYEIRERDNETNIKGKCILTSNDKPSIVI